MALELTGVSRIDTPAEARSHARRWSRMAREIDTPDAPDEVKAKARELRQRSQAASEWARRQEDALVHAQRGHDEELERHANVVPIKPGATKPAPSSRARRAARVAGHSAYRQARPPAMRLAHRGRQHFFQGVQEPLGPAGAGWDLLFEALGLTVAVVVIADLLRAPSAIASTSSHAVEAVRRAVDVVDPITGRHAPGYEPPRAAARPQPTT